MTDGADPNPVRGKLAPAWATNLGASVADRKKKVRRKELVRRASSSTLGELRYVLDAAA